MGRPSGGPGAPAGWDAPLVGQGHPLDGMQARLNPWASYLTSNPPTQSKRQRHFQGVEQPKTQISGLSQSTPRPHTVPPQLGSQHTKGIPLPPGRTPGIPLWELIE